MEQNAVITRKEFDKKMELHRLWVDEIEGGEMASFSGEHFAEEFDMSGMDLRYVDFTNAYLYHANLSGSDLKGADFSGAYMPGANLNEAKINSTNFKKAYMKGATLTGAEINHSSFEGAELYEAYFRNAAISHTHMDGTKMVRAVITDASLNVVLMGGADLSGASFGGSKLGHVNMRMANIQRANFTSAHIKESCCFEHANLASASFTSASISKDTSFESASLQGCRFDGEERNRLGRILDHPIKGYKRSGEGDIVTLEIPAGAIVFSINNGKCRTNIAKVVDTVGKPELTSIFDREFKYRVGDEITPKNGFDLAYNVECASGIHFFLTREEAEAYHIPVHKLPVRK